MATAPFDLRARARQAMLDAGFTPDFPADVCREIQALKPMASLNGAVRELRSLLWSSIDNDSSKDLDQVEYVEKLPDGTVRLLVGIADVDATVRGDSATSHYAAGEATSVYTGVAVFPMLPNELSTDLTSLRDSQDRLSIVIELRVLGSGEVKSHDVYPAWLRNRAKLAYNSTGAWLEGHDPIPPAIAAVPGMDAQLRLQLETSQRLRALRKQHGALTLGSIEATPIVQDGEVKELAVRRHTVAEDIIESFMVSANVAIAEYLRERGALCLRRVVRTPKRWDGIQFIAAKFGVKLPLTPDPRALSEFLEKRNAADPVHFPDLSLSIVKLLGPGEYIVETPGAEREGHFGLAAQDYTHSTAPNRRYADLMTQRLLKAASTGAPAPCSEAELRDIAAHCTEREDAAKKVERLMRKVAAACLLNSRIGEIFDGVVTGASPKGTYARLLKVPAEGRIVRGMQGLHVGDAVRVRLAAVEIHKGFIDFARE